MPSITRARAFAVELPFRNPFKHSAAERASSNSLFLELTLSDGQVGFGECLPRRYVTGEDRDASFTLLEQHVLPRLLGRTFSSMEEVMEFLAACDGKAPPRWLDPALPQTAAWSAVDLALLDAFGRSFGCRALESRREPLPSAFRYSGVLSATSGWPMFRSALKQRLFGIRQIKLKVEGKGAEDSVRTARRALGRRLDLRVDANMAWSVEEAIPIMQALARHGVRSFEQPLPADDIDGMARLVAETGLGVMADESLGDRDSLTRLIEARACTAVSIRVSKCGGLVASLARAKEALAAGLTVQIGCQVGESSLMSAAHLALVQCVQQVAYGEGCFGHFLLREDPASPLLQFGFGGRPPEAPPGPGLGVSVQVEPLATSATKIVTLGGQ